MNLEETADFISPNLPQWKRDANLEFLIEIHGLVKLGGIWGYPAADMVFIKTDEGFELQLDS